MKTLARIALALVVALSFVAGAYAADQTLSGDVVCAKCGLKKADAKACQNVLVVKDGDATTEYYIEKNDVATKFGDVCTAKKPVTVTGAVSEKDGKKWIAATKIEDKKS